MKGTCRGIRAITPTIVGSGSKQAPDNQEQKKIDGSEFDAEDEYYKGVPEGTERP